MKSGRKVLVIDIGGSNVKLSANGHRKAVKVSSGNTLTPAQLFKQTAALTSDWQYDAVSIGYPGPVLGGRPAVEPVHLGKGWVKFDYSKCFTKPIKIINDAALQALGSYKGGRMLFIGLGTGLGSALILDDLVVPLELCHLRYSRLETVEDYVGKEGLKTHGRKKWEKAVHDLVAELRESFLVDDIVIGGGNAKKLDRVPDGSRLGSNRHSFLGGMRLWQTIRAAANSRKPRWKIG